MTAPYLTDTVDLGYNLIGADFCVALAHDGKTGQANFNKWVDAAYKKAPLFALVKPDPAQYSQFTLGTWPPFESDPALKWMKSHFLAPDGKTRYAIAGVLLDMRSYYDKNGNLYSGNWISGVVRHWRKYLTEWGFKTYLFIGPELERLFPDNAKDPAVFVQTEQNPVAVYETSGAVCKWPLAKFIKRVNVSEWELVISRDALYKMIGWQAVAPPVAEPPVPPIVQPLTLEDRVKYLYDFVRRIEGLQ